MEQVLLVRSLFGITMAFHIIFATLGVGIPVMILLAELLFQKTKDPTYQIMTKRWTKGLAILLGVAIPSGTIAGMQLSLLWPKFMEIVGQVIALPFQMEIFAFFLEAIFMSIYVYAYDHLSNKVRTVCVAFVALGAALSAVLITNVHAFEATPRGFRMDANGNIVDVNPMQAFFNPSFGITAFHVVTSAITTGGFIIASISSLTLLKQALPSKIVTYHKKIITLGVVIGGTCSLLTAINGHSSAQMLHHHQPEKLAAAEGLFETTAKAPLAIGGFVDKETEKIKHAIEIPMLLSFLAGNSIHTVVRGLHDFPKDEWPPLYIHILFNAMVLIGTFLILLTMVYLYFIRKRKKLSRFLLAPITIAGPLSMLATEFGWIFSCVGRQPWTIYKIQKTAEAATQTANVKMLAIVFPMTYFVLIIGTGLVLRYQFNRHKLEKEFEKNEDRKELTHD